MHELNDFAEELIREVRDDSVGQIARYLAGLYGDDHPMVACWQREMPDEHRLAIANAIVHSVDVALNNMMRFIEERIDTEISLTIKDGTSRYTVHGTDMLNAWYGTWVDDFAKATGEGLMKQAREAEQQK
jgi:hypothetical protein